MAGRFRFPPCRRPHLTPPGRPLRGAPCRAGRIDYIEYLG